MYISELTLSIYNIIQILPEDNRDISKRYTYSYSYS